MSSKEQTAKLLVLTGLHFSLNVFGVFFAMSVFQNMVLGHLVAIFVLTVCIIVFARLDVAVVDLINETKQRK